MATAPFAALETRLNGAVEAHLSNALATHKGGVAFGVDFGRGRSGDPFGGQAIDAADFVVSFDIARAPAIAEGDELVIGGVNYLVSSGVQPDQSGWVNLSVYPKPVAATPEP